MPAGPSFSTLPLFRDLTPSQIAQAQSVLHTVELPEGSTLMSGEQPGENVYVVAKGSVRICPPDGAADAVVAVRGPGDVIGEMSVLAGVTRSATVIVREPSVFYWVSRTDFWTVLWEMPPIPYNLAGILAHRVRILTAQVHVMATMDAPGRLGRQLLTLAEEYGGSAEQAGAVKIPFQLQTEELAGMIGASVEQVTALLAEWQDNGLIARDGGNIVICRREALREV